MPRPWPSSTKDGRTAADYDETILPSPEEAREALQAASSFLAICGTRYGFIPPRP